MSYNTHFLSGPHKFANTHTVYPSADPVVNQNHLRVVNLSDGSELTEIKGANKVAYCDIVTSGTLDRVPGDMGAIENYNSHEDLLVMRVSYKKTKSSAFPVYYLPWKKDSLMRMTLKPSQAHGPTKGVLSKTVIEPNVFITAALQGCSVIVSGEPQRPVVYHANAASTKGPGGETLTGNDAAFDAAAQSKITRMQDMYQRARTEQQKEGPKGPGGARPPVGTYQSRSAHLTDYLRGNQAGQGAILKRQYGQQFQINEDRFNLIQFGTVFGIRENGTWVFYRQTRTRLMFRDGTNRWINPICVRFWP